MINSVTSQNLENGFVPHATHTVMMENLLSFQTIFVCHFGTNKKNDSILQLNDDKKTNNQFKNGYREGERETQEGRDMRIYV